MGLSLINLRAETLAELGVDSTDLDATGSANLDLLINRSWWEVAGKFKFHSMESHTTFPTVSGTREYNLTTVINTAAMVVFEALKYLSVLNPDSNQHVPLTEWSVAQYEANYNEDTETRDIPTNYVRYGDGVLLYPTPDDVYTITTYFTTVLPDVPSGGPDVPQEWHEMVLYGAIWRGHARFRDYNSRDSVRNAQIGLISTAQTDLAKDDKEKKFIGVELPHLSSGRRY